MVKTADDPTSVGDLIPMALALIGAAPPTPTPERAKERTHR